MKAVTETKSEVTRGPGRPNSFPGVETRLWAGQLPVETVEALRAEAARRGVTMNALANTFIERGIKAAANRRQGAEAQA